LFRDHPESVSAVIALSAICAALLSQVCSFLARRWAYWQLRRAWRTALAIELEYLLEVIDELTMNVNGSGYSIKRLNDDFLQDARLKGYTFDVRPKFLKRLAAAYRDVVHTNSVLDLAMVVKRPSSPESDTAKASLDAVGKSIRKLKNCVDPKLLHLLNLRRYRREQPEPPDSDSPPPVSIATPIQRSDGAAQG
jgi:hypothetical protein